MPIQDPNPELKEKMPRIVKMRAVVGGEDILKGEIGDYNPKTFLPDFIPSDEERYQQYLLRAVFYNYTNWTLQGFHGSVFRKPFAVETPANIDYINEDITGKSQGLEDFAKNVVKEVLTVARIGLLVEYPIVEDQLSQADTDTMGHRATVKTYSAECAYNWDEVREGGQLKLTQVRLAETKKTNTDEFMATSEEEYRILSLDESGRYMQRVYNKSDELIEGPYYPRKYNGEYFNEIPFIFVGSEDNTADIDKPPLLDIANINLAHYRNSADKEENLHHHGQGTLFISSDMTADQFKKANPGGIKVGARSGHFIGANGDATLLQLEAAGAIAEDMKDKVVQMIGIGARFIQDKSGNQTAEAAKIGAKQQESGLSVAVGNCSAAIQQCLVWIAEFMGAEDTNIVFELTQDFFDTTLTAQEITAIMMLEESSYMAKVDVQYLLKKAGILRGDRTSEDIKNDIDTQGI